MEGPPRVPGPSTTRAVYDAVDVDAHIGKLHVLIAGLREELRATTADLEAARRGLAEARVAEPERSLQAAERLLADARRDADATRAAAQAHADAIVSGARALGDTVISGARAEAEAIVAAAHQEAEALVEAARAHARTILDDVEARVNAVVGEARATVISEPDAPAASADHPPIDDGRALDDGVGGEGITAAHDDEDGGGWRERWHAARSGGFDLFDEGRDAGRTRVLSDLREILDVDDVWPQDPGADESPPQEAGVIERAVARAVEEAARESAPTPGADPEAERPPGASDGAVSFPERKHRAPTLGASLVPLAAMALMTQAPPVSDEPASGVAPPPGSPPEGPAPTVPTPEDPTRHEPTARRASTRRHARPGMLQRWRARRARAR